MASGAAIAPATQVVGGRIERVDVSGNTRTSTEVILRALRLGPGTAYRETLPAALRARLLNLRLFKAVEVQGLPAGDGGWALQITVAERWTLIPVPFASSSSGQWKAGLFLVESNLLGLNKVLALGGYVGNRGDCAFLVYRDPALLGTDWTASGQFVYLDSVHSRYAGDTPAERFQDRRVDVSANLGRRFGRTLSAAVGGFALWTRPKALAVWPVLPLQSQRVFGLSAEGTWDAQDFHFYFNQGPLVTLKWSEALSALGSDRALHRLSAKATFGTVIGPGHALTLTGRFDLSLGDPLVDALLLGGEPGTRGFQTGGLWGEEAATVTLDYQIPLWRPSLGTVTAGAFLDSGVVRWRGETTPVLSPGLGTRLYLQGLALPALGVDMAFNPRSKEVLVSLAVGVSL
jgi:outer membrane protein assembly factor BamA